MDALSIADLSRLEGEPTVRDVRLGEVLGFSRARDLRQLIDGNIAEIEQYGLARRVAAPIRSGKGRIQYVGEYWLNEAQALLVCMFARTEKAAAVRKQVIDVFVAYRRGELMQTASQPDEVLQRLERMERRLTALQALGDQVMRGAKTQATAIALTYADAVWSVGRPGRRPKWWSDLEVRAFLLTQHRQSTLHEVRVESLGLFGPDRTPSKSAIHRFWQTLDRLRSVSPSMQVH